MTAMTGAARAESPEQADPPFRFLRYNDDFTYLANKPNPTPWERVKYIPLGSSLWGPSYLSLGGELRERWETYQRINYGIGKAQAASGYLLERANLNADLHVTDYFRAYATLGDDRIFGRRGASSSTDADRWELFQRFVEARLPSPFGDQPSIRYGREELAFGFQRLIAAREGPNARRDFDGLRVTDKIGEASVDILAVQPAVNTEYAMDDSTNRAQRLSGVYVTTPVIGPLKTDLYVLDYENNSIKMRGLSGSEKAQTLGARLFGKAGGFDWNLEGSWQTGRFRSGAQNFNIEAHLLAVVAGYTFAATPWTPRIGFSANDASGDNAHNKTTIGTFNAMFPRLPYFAETSVLVPSNVRDFRPVLCVTPVERVTVVLGYDMLWRASTTDGLYGSGFSALANTSKARGSRVGSEVSMDARWQYNESLQLGAILAQFQAGPALTSAGGKNMTFGVLFAKLKF
ncbi:hypothetical protein GGD83_001744 [Rhodoblastus sphagnicola]|nr:alginate export family protein [Rhodoblastus sphagnicola]MBB4197951.1 hypothetical protein [Rhodoblastus sphagnicola]